MDCVTARDATSALLDGEPAGVPRSRLESHLAACAECRAWREQAHEVTRRMRLAEAAPAPVPDASLLASMRALERRGSWWRTLALTRLALVLVGLAQIALSLPDLLAGAYRDAPIHVAHEMGALDLALAAGFLVAACRPARAQGMRALVGCAALLLLVTAAIDLLAGRTSLGDEAPHLLVLAGWLLLRRTAMLMPSGEDHTLPRPSSLHRLRDGLAPPWRSPADRRSDGGSGGGGEPSRPGVPDGVPDRVLPIRTVDAPGPQEVPQPRRSAESG
jgi:predicted anti-sigma-YlaC factor YlaD